VKNINWLCDTDSYRIQYRFIRGCVFGARGTVTIITTYGGMKETLMASALVTTSLVSGFDDCGFFVKYR
jgi:hypothetical protein